jgi:protein TonB
MDYARADPVEACRPPWPFEPRLGAAVIASIAVHIAAMSFSPPRVSLPEAPPVLEVSLREQAAFASAPPEPARPAPATPAGPRLDSLGSAKPRKHEQVLSARTDAPAPSPVRNAEPVPASTSAPEATAAVSIPSPEAAQSATAARAPEPHQSLSELISVYGQTISRLLTPYRKYPPIARMQGWEGLVTMELRVAPSGRLLDAAVRTSSGHEVLDRQALAMASQAEPFPAPPAALRDREITVVVVVPVVFRLER